MAPTTFTVPLERRAERELRGLPQNVVRRIDVMFRRLTNNTRPSVLLEVSETTARG